MPTLPESGAPLISVVIPVRNDAANLRECIGHLRRSDFTDYEIIVVDDASTDHTPEVAEALAARVLHRTMRGGPAAARNQGAEVARGRYLFFVDADVCVHPKTLGRAVAAFERDPDADAVFGSYDASPRALNIISQYRNLLHHFVHQTGNRRASTFWAGCGAIKRRVFLDFGGFDTKYRRPCIEDIELGVRLNRCGRKIVLDPEIQGTHLKKWTLLSMFRTDIFDRALPWSALILEGNEIPNDLNLRRSQRFSALLSVGMLVTLGLALEDWYRILAFLVVVVGVIIAFDRWSVSRRISTGARALAVLGVIGANLMLAQHSLFWTAVTLVLLGAFLWLNADYYRFLARVKHPLFAAFALPLHIGYFVSSLVSFALVFAARKGSALLQWIKESTRRLRRRPVTASTP